MSRKEWHSDENTEVFHNNKDCNTGNNIETENIESGTGGHRLCEECKRNNKHSH